jgi:hypothetical protein
MGALLAGPGLPDLSWYNIPKRGNMYQIATKRPLSIPNGCKIDRMYIKYANLFHSKTLQKFTQNLDFWFENIPSGNSGLG